MHSNIRTSVENFAVLRPGNDASPGNTRGNRDADRRV